MNEAILTPDKIVRLQDSGIAYKELMRYSQEVTETAIIICSEEMKRLYESNFGSNNGMATCRHEIYLIAENFVQEHAHIDFWERYATEQNRYPNCEGWEDYVIAYGKEKVTHIISVNQHLKTKNT
jgi:hypothetical protein